MTDLARLSLVPEAGRGHGGVYDGLNAGRVGFATTPKTCPEMQLRMNLIATVPALSFSAAEHYEAWEQAIREFAGRASANPARCTRWRWGVRCSPSAMPAYDRWSARADNDLTVYLDAALTALEAGFVPEAMLTGVSATRADTPVTGVSATRAD